MALDFSKQLEMHAPRQVSSAMDAKFVKHKEQMKEPAANLPHVLLVCHDRYLSGANRALIDWLEGRDHSKALITILLPRNNEESRRQFEALGCEVWSAPFVLSVKYLESQGLPRTIKGFMKRMWSLLVHPVLARRIARKAREKGVNIVHSNSFATTFGAEIAEAMGVPHVWHIREFCEEDHGFTHYNLSHLESLCKHSHAIFISDVVRDYQVQRHVFLSGSVIYDSVHFDPDVAISRSFMEDGVCNIIMVGAIAKGKGQLEAIKAVKIMRDEGKNVRLYLCGQGDRGMLKPILAGCEDFILDLGYRDDVTQIRTMMDIALVCSRMEAFGRVTVEGQYYGNVVIGADAGCSPYLIENGKTGFLYEKGNSEDLARKIEFCIDNPALMMSIKSKARSVAIRCYANDISGHIYRIYEHVLATKFTGDRSNCLDMQWRGC